MLQYPVHFLTSALTTAGIDSTWTTESLGRETICAIPAEFEGPGGGISPEDLFAQALTNCFVATFKVYAEKSKVTFDNLSVNTELAVDLNETKKPVMKTCTISAVITGAREPERIKLLAHKAFASGFILNSVKTELHLDLQIL